MGAHAGGAWQHTATKGLRAPSWFARTSREQPRTSHGQVAAAGEEVITAATCKAARTSAEARLSTLRAGTTAPP
jgi:hypothetical protein